MTGLKPRPSERSRALRDGAALPLGPNIFGPSRMWISRSPGLSGRRLVHALHWVRFAVGR